MRYLLNEQLKFLIELQKLDSVILSTRFAIDAIPAEISSHEEPLNAARKAYENAQQHHASLEKKKKDTEHEIQEINGKITKQKQRSAEIKNNKEYQAHLKEIEKTETVLKSLEDTMLSILSELEQSSKSLAEEKCRIAAETEKVDTLKKGLEQKVHEQEAGLKRLKGSRKQIVEKIDSDVYSLYVSLMKTRRGIAVVEAKNELCTGCNIHIPPQLFVEIKTTDEISHCPQCRRILYYLTPDNNTASL